MDNIKKHIKLMLFSILKILFIPSRLFMSCLFRLIEDKKQVLEIFMDIIPISKMYVEKYMYARINIFEEKIIPALYEDDVAIVMQGPIMYKDNLTVNILGLYRRWYPSVRIIVSTWENCIKEDFLSFCNINKIKLISNSEPERVDGWHISHQMKSSYAGVKYVSENYNDVRYVLKCRTDQYIFRYDFLTYFKNLLKIFPVNNNKLPGRIILLGHYNSFRNVPFHLCDFIAFGHVKTICKLFDIHDYTGDKNKDLELCNIRNKQAKYELYNNDSEEVRRLWNGMNGEAFAPEMYIFSSFYNSNIESIDYEKYLEQYRKFLKDYVIIVDSSQLLFFWPKYSDKYEINTCYSKYGSLDFISWLEIYSEGMINEKQNNI